MGTAVLNYNDEKYYEIIGGKKYMPPSPILEHDETIFSLRNLFTNILRGKSFKIYGENTDVILSRDDRVMPDLKIVGDFSKISDGKNIKGAPDFILEVLSLGNSSHDLIFKRNLYERHGVKEYWIVDIYTKDVYVYVLKDGVYGDPTIYHNFTQDEIDDIEQGVFNDYLKEQSKIKEIVSNTFGEEIRVPIAKIFENI